MTYDQALAIAKANAPELIIMPPFKSHPELFAVKKSEISPPFSIHLPDTKAVMIGLSASEIAEQETKMLIDSLNAAKR